MLVDKYGKRFKKGISEDIQTYQKEELKWLMESFNKISNPNFDKSFGACKIYLSPGSKAYRERQEEREKKGLDIVTFDTLARFITRGENVNQNS